MHIYAKKASGQLQQYVLDDSCTTASPCLTCPRKDKDKLTCCQCCLRLQAYRDGLSYAHLPPVDLKKVQKIPSQMTRVSKVYEKCLIPGCDKDGNYKMVCQRHYQQWRRGKILHPAIGEWIPGLRKSTNGSYKYKGQYLVVDWQKVMAAYNKKHKTKYKVLKSLIKDVYTEQRIMIKTAKELGVSHAVLLKKMKELKIERFKKGHRGNPAGLELIKKLGDTSKMSCPEIAKKIGMSQPYVWRLCRKHEIKHKRNK